MLASVGQKGPEISVDLLPSEVPESTPAELAAARERLVIAGVPMVLCVGNAGAAQEPPGPAARGGTPVAGGTALHACSRGRPIVERRPSSPSELALAQAANRPVETVTTMPDSMLWAAYRLARCMVFPSLNEGFGLPIAESLSCGTPVVTSGYGSMAEIAAGGGALLVDPRDDHSLAAGMRTVLTDDEVAPATRPQRRAPDPRGPGSSMRRRVERPGGLLA